VEYKTDAAGSGCRNFLNRLIIAGNIRGKKREMGVVKNT
jgi:hypothetical protein